MTSKISPLTNELYPTGYKVKNSKIIDLNSKKYNLAYSMYPHELITTIFGTCFYRSKDGEIVRCRMVYRITAYITTIVMAVLNYYATFAYIPQVTLELLNALNQSLWIFCNIITFFKADEMISFLRKLSNIGGKISSPVHYKALRYRVNTGLIVSITIAVLITVLSPTMPRLNSMFGLMLLYTVTFNTIVSMNIHTPLIVMMFEYSMLLKRIKVLCNSDEHEHIGCKGRVLWFFGFRKSNTDSAVNDFMTVETALKQFCDLNDLVVKYNSCFGWQILIKTVVEAVRFCFHLQKTLQGGVLDVKLKGEVVDIATYHGSFAEGQISLLCLNGSFLVLVFVCELMTRDAAKICKYINQLSNEDFVGKREKEECIKITRLMEYVKPSVTLPGNILVGLGFVAAFIQMSLTYVIAVMAIT